MDVASPSQRSMLMRVMSYMEMDPCNQDKWVEEALLRSSQQGGLPLLDVFKDMKKKQTGGFIDNSISPNTYNTVVAPPQAGKTQGIMLTAMEASYDSNVLTVMGAMNSVLETPRFRATADKLNGIVEQIAGRLGIAPGLAPKLKIFDEGSSITYKRALTEWSKGSNVIPVFVVMMNNKKFDKFQANHLPDITKVVEKDSHGHYKIMLVMDEADLQFKSDSNSSQLERSIFGKKQTIDQRQFDTLQDVFTTVTSVTATPQAIATGEVKFGGRQPVVFEPQPSSSSFQYHTKDGWENKLITRVCAGGPEEMYEDMMADEENRFALVYESKNCKVEGRSAAALATAEKFAGKPGVVTFAWSSGKIEAYTADPSWIQLFRGSPAGVFAVKQENNGVFSFTGSKSTVSSYPSIINFMETRSADSAKCKFILFAKELTDRAIPVKGTDHQWPLTDMWLESPKIPQEARIQVCGRLCGIDPVGTVKRLWCSEEEHEHHKKSIDTVQYIVEKLLRTGIGAQDAIAKTRKTLVDLTDDDSPVVSKIVVDEDGAIFHLGGTKITRPGAGKRTRELAVDTKRTVASKKMKLSDDTYQSGLSHADVTGGQTDDPSDSSASSPVDLSAGGSADGSADGSVDDTNVLRQMREAASGESGKGVVDAIIEVIRDNGDPVTLSRMAPDMASRSQFPDGCAFSPLAFLKFIVREKMDLLTSNGVQYMNGSFWEV